MLLFDKYTNFILYDNSDGFIKEVDVTLTNVDIIGNFDIDMFEIN